MGLFKSLRGNHPDHIGGESSQQGSSSRDGNSGAGYAPPSQPPPADHSKSDSYAAPTGPPPAYKNTDYAPPAGPPPSQSSEISSAPPAYHDWTVIPDTSLLPPPPSLSSKYSPTSNAEESEAIRAHQWCARYALMEPHAPTSSQLAAVQSGQVSLHRPKEYTGNLAEISTGSHRGSTRAGSKDSCLISSLPLYFAAAESPFRTEVPKTVYFEVKIVSLGKGRGMNECSLAIGFVAVPYPTWRMPGWERGSLGVHSDDGHRYINNTDGGVEFTSPFQVGETIGLGLTFSVPDHAPDFSPSPLQGMPLKAIVFMTRNGKPAGGWNLQEELDSTSEFGVFGVDGKYDLFGALGTFGEVSFEVSFNRRDWLWQPQ